MQESRSFDPLRSDGMKEAYFLVRALAQKIHPEEGTR